MAQKITFRDFVLIWLQSTSVAEVAEKTGLTINSVRAKATALRKAGVKLEKKARHTTPLDVSGLNAIIDNSCKAIEDDTDTY